MCRGRRSCDNVIAELAVCDVAEGTARMILPRWLRSSWRGTAFCVVRVLCCVDAGVVMMSGIGNMDGVA